jgi:hypothetical protein
VRGVPQAIGAAPGNHRYLCVVGSGPFRMAYAATRGPSL